MNRIILITFFSVLTFSSCSLGENDEQQQIQKTYWHLINVSGGVAGVDHDFPLNQIIWSFNETTLKLTVTNTNTDTTVEDGFDSGVYNYSVITSGVDEYVVINSNELGQLTVTETNLVIDENLTSTGSVSDGFVYTFRRVTVVEDVN